jgi:hypothetical protein
MGIASRIRVLIWASCERASARLARPESRRRAATQRAREGQLPESVLARLRVAPDNARAPVMAPPHRDRRGSPRSPRRQRSQSWRSRKQRPAPDRPEPQRARGRARGSRRNPALPARGQVAATKHCRSAALLARCSALSLVERASRVAEGLANVFDRQIRIVAQDLVLGHPVGEHRNHGRHRDPQAADARHAAHLVGSLGDHGTSLAPPWSAADPSSAFWISNLTTRTRMNLTRCSRRFSLWASSEGGGPVEEFSFALCSPPGEHLPPLPDAPAPGRAAGPNHQQEPRWNRNH